MTKLAPDNTTTDCLMTNINIKLQFPPASVKQTWERLQCWKTNVKTQKWVTLRGRGWKPWPLNENSVWFYVETWLTLLFYGDCYEKDVHLPTKMLQLKSRHSKSEYMINSAKQKHRFGFQHNMLKPWGLRRNLTCKCAPDVRPQIINDQTHNFHLLDSKRALQRV